MVHCDLGYTASGPNSCLCLPITALCLQHTDSLMPRCAGGPFHCDDFIMLAVELQLEKRQQDESRLALRSDSTLNFHSRGAPVMNRCPCNKPAPRSRRASWGLPDELAAVLFPSFVGLDSAPHFRVLQGRETRSSTEAE